MAELQLRSFGKSVLAALLLGRWEDVFLEVSKLSNFALTVILRAIQARKEKVRQWLEAPLVSGGPLPTPWTRLKMPIGPLGRSTLLMLRKVQRWQVLLGESFCPVWDSGQVSLSALGLEAEATNWASILSRFCCGHLVGCSITKEDTDFQAY